jgi:hypothetical protein
MFEWRILALFAIIGFAAIAIKMVESPIIAQNSVIESS